MLYVRMVLCTEENADSEAKRLGFDSAKEMCDETGLEPKQLIGNYMPSADPGVELANAANTVISVVGWWYREGWSVDSRLAYVDPEGVLWCWYPY